MEILILLGVLLLLLWLYLYFRYFREKGDTLMVAFAHRDGVDVDGFAVKS